MNSKKQVFRIGVKNYPAAHGGVEMCTYNFVKAEKDKYDFTIFTVWENPDVTNNCIDGVKVYQLAKGWMRRFRQIRGAVRDKRNTILDFQMEIFIPLAILFSVLGYNVVSTVHGRSWWNVKISRIVRWLICVVDILGVNLVRRTIYVSKWDFDAMKRYTLRRFFWIPNGSCGCAAINYKPTKDIVFIGRISVQKNLLALIAAAEKYKRHLDIYGPFDEREVEHTAKIKAALKSSQYVKYCGFLPPEKIYSTLSNYKCAVNPSKSEASPCAVIEAGACGLYLYLSDIPGHRGVGYPDVHYFNADMIDLSHDKKENIRSAANLAHHRDCLSLERQVLQTEEVYESF